MDITPDKLETGEKMALLTPGGEHDLELLLLVPTKNYHQGQSIRIKNIQISLIR